MLMVLVGHLYVFGDVNHVLRAEMPWVGLVLGRIASGGGNLGVGLFFVLSGFLITGILLDAKGGDRFFRNFYARRFLRIFPLYYGTLFVVLIVLPLFLQARSERLQAILNHQMWLWLYGSNLPGGWNLPHSCEYFQLTHFWSLAVEEHFYLLWPLIIFCFSRRSLFAICKVLLVAPTFLRIALAVSGMSDWFINVFTLCRVDGLALGGVLALLVRSEPVACRTISRWTRPVILVGFPLVVACLFLPRSVSWIGTLFGPLINGLFFAGVLMFSLQVPRNALWGRFLHARAMRSLGQYSYGIYVLHFVFRPYYSRLLSLNTMAESLGSLIAAAIVQFSVWFVLSIVLAWGSWHLYEKHFLKLKRYFEYGIPSTVDVVADVSGNSLAPSVARGVSH